MPAEAPSSRYIRFRGQVTGPFESDVLSIMTARGQITRFHEVSIDGQSWRPAGKDESLSLFRPEPKTPGAKPNEAALELVEEVGDPRVVSIPPARQPPALPKQVESESNLPVITGDKVNAKARRVAGVTKKTVACPICGEQIQASAVKCRHCGEWLGEGSAIDDATQESISPLPPRSYLNSAVLTLILYGVGFGIVGLIANIVYLSSANTYEHKTGQAPEGKGCLVALIWVFAIIPLIVGLVLLVIYLVISKH